MALEDDLKSFEWIWTTHFDEFMLLETGTGTQIVRCSEHKYFYMTIENADTAEAVIRKMREAGIRVIDNNEFKRLQEQNISIEGKSATQKVKPKVPASLRYVRLVFALLFAVCGAIGSFFFTYPPGCTWDRHESRASIYTPPNSTLNSVTGPSREFVVEEATLRDVVSYYEGEVGFQCQVYTGNSYNTAYAHCSGEHQDFGAWKYTVYITNRDGNRQQQTLIYTAEWQECQIGWRFQDR